MGFRKGAVNGVPRLTGRFRSVEQIRRWIPLRLAKCSCAQNDGARSRLRYVPMD